MFIGLPSKSQELLRYVVVGRVVLALAVLTLLCGLFFWPIWTPDERDRLIFNQNTDFVLHYQAPIAYQVERLQAGELPLWNPYNSSGEPLAANIQYNMFYPVRYLLALFDGGQWDVGDYQREVIAHYWLASMTMWLFLWGMLANAPGRDMLALAGAVMYAYSGFATGYPMLQPNMVVTLAWLPLLLWTVHLSLHQPPRRMRAGVGGALVVGLMILGGHPQLTLYALGLVMAYLLWDGMEAGVPAGTLLGLGLLVGGFGAGLAAVQILPMVEFTGLSDRAADFAYAEKSGGLPVSQFNQLVWPNPGRTWSMLYMGVAGMLFSIGALLRLQGAGRFWAGVLLFGLLFSLGGAGVLYDVFYLIVPGFDLFRNQERVVLLVLVAIVMLAIHQTRWLLDNPPREAVDRDRLRFQRFAAGYVGLLVAVFVLAVLGHRLGIVAVPPDTALGHVALMGGLALLWLNWMQVATSPAWLRVVPLLGIIVLDLFAVGKHTSNLVENIPENRPYLPSALEAYRVPDDREIMWRVDGAAGLRGVGTFFRVPDIYGVSPVGLDSTARLRSLPVDRMWEVLAVRYVTLMDEPPPNVGLELIGVDRSSSGAEFRVFELEDPRPLAHLVYDTRHAEGSAAFAREIMSDPRVNLREMAITRLPLSLALPGTRPAEAQVDSLHFETPEDLRITVSTPENALLTLAIPQYPGWQATINGQPVEIVDVYAGLIGVPITAGDDQQIRVWLSSEPVQMGAWITGLSLLGLLGLAAWDVIRRRHPSA